MGRGIANRMQTRRLRPSRRSIKRGILVPGDGPPTGVHGSFYDYRDVLLPKDCTVLKDGIFPLGRIQHPGSDTPDFPIVLGWEHVSQHVAIVGPPGSGKTFNILAPWIIAASAEGMATIAVDVKGDLRRELKSAKTRLGLSNPLPIITWDISEPAASRPWNPLSEVTSPEHASQVAMAFLGEIRPDDRNKFFAERDHRWLRGLVWLVANAYGTNAHPSLLFRLIVSQKDLIDSVQRSPYAAHEILDLVRFDSSKYTEATAGLANRLSWLAEPALAEMLDGTKGRSFTLHQALNSGAILLVGARERGGERSVTAAAILLNLLRLKCLSRFGVSPPPIFWVLDEAARYAARVQLDQMLDLLRGADSPVCLGLQDVNHLGTENEQVRMLANCDTFIALKGVSQHTAKFFSDRLGNTAKAIATDSLLPTGQWQPTLSYQDQPILGQREIMYPPVGTYGGVVQIRSGSPLPLLFSFS